MKRKTQGPPQGEPWVWLSRELLRSDAWRTASGNVRRVVDILLIEHMSKGGRENGKLKAPYRQLVAFGISSRFVADYIRKAEELGLIECHRGGRRVATTYRLTWLDAHDGSPAEHQWRQYRNAALAPMPVPKIKNLHLQVSAGLHLQVSADGANLPVKGSADGPKSLPAKVSAPSRKDSYQGGEDTSDLSVGTARSVLRVVKP